MFFSKIINKIKELIRRYNWKNNDEIIFRVGLASLLASKNNYKNYKSLFEADFKVFSQFGEDGIIDYILNRLEIYKPSFVEIGTQDYSESNTRFIYQRTNTYGLIIDCDVNLKNKVKKTLFNYFWKGNIQINSEFINRENILMNLSPIIKNNKIEVDVFSLDIDGNDYWIMEEIMPFMNSELIILEYNPFFGSKLSLSTPYIKNFNRTRYHFSNLCFGASLKAFYQLLENFGYVFLGSNINNNNGFWIKKSKLDLFNLDLPNINSLSNYTNCFTRESRNIKGELTLLNKDQIINEIKNCKVVNLEDSDRKIFEIKDLYL